MLTSPSDTVERRTLIDFVHAALMVVQVHVSPACYGRKRDERVHGWIRGVYDAVILPPGGRACRIACPSVLGHDTATFECCRGAVEPRKIDGTFAFKCVASSDRAYAAPRVGAVGAEEGVLARGLRQALQRPASTTGNPGTIWSDSKLKSFVTEVCNTRIS